MSRPAAFPFLFALAALSAGPDASAQWLLAGKGYNGGVRAFASSTGKDVFIATWGGDSSGIYRSVDDGATWKRARNGFTGNHCLEVTAYGEFVYAGCESGGAYRSNNNGSSWNQFNSGLPDTVVHAFAFMGSRMFAGTGGGAAFAAIPVTDWYPVPGPKPAFTSFAFAGTDLVGGTSDGLLFSTSLGKAWERRAGALSDSEYVTCLLESEGRLYAGTYDTLYVSADGGMTFQPAAKTPFSGVDCLLAFRDTVYLGAPEGVFRSIDDGATWQSLGGGLPSFPVTALFMKDGWLFAGTDNEGVWKWKVGSATTSIRPRTASRAPHRAGFTDRAGHRRNAIGVRLDDSGAR